MTTLDQIEAIKSAVNSLNHNVRCAYVNGMALRNLYKERETAVLFLLGQHSAPEVLNIANSTMHTIGIARAEAQAEFATTKLLLDLSEGSTEFQEAYALIQPQLEEITRLEGIHQAAVQARSDKARALAEAEEAALQAAKKAAESDPKVIAARKALEALDQPAKKGKSVLEVGETS